MWYDPDDFRHLRTLLATWLPRTDLELIVHDAGLPGYRIEEGKTLELAWHRTLEFALRQGPNAVERVLDLASERAPILLEERAFTGFLARARAAGTSRGARASGGGTGDAPSLPPGGRGRPRVFISHRTADAAEAEQLAEALRARGVDVRLDIWEVTVGDSIVGWMNDAVQDVSFVALCYSRHGLDAPWVALEWQAALTRQLNGESIKLLPVYLTGREGPPILDPYKAADWMSDPKQAVDDLVRAIFRDRAPGPLDRRV